MATLRQDHFKEVKQSSAFPGHGRVGAEKRSPRRRRRFFGFEQSGPGGFQSGGRSALSFEGRQVRGGFAAGTFGLVESIPTTIAGTHLAVCPLVLGL